VQNHVSPGERNPIEGKFGQAKTRYGLNWIKARLRETSETWIASIILVLNLVKLAGLALPCLFSKLVMSFSARRSLKSILQIYLDYSVRNKLPGQLFNSQLVEMKIAA